MMQYIREHATGKLAKFLFLGIGISFLGFGTTGFLARPSGDVVAKVNGQKIYTAELTNRYNNFLRANDIDSSVDQKELKRLFLNSMIERIVLQQTANKLGVVASDDEVASKIRSTQMFQDETGKFDENRYKIFLQSNNLSYAQWQDDQRQELSQQLLLEGIADSVIVTNADIIEMAKIQGEKRDVAFVNIPFASFYNEINISDSMINEYYEQNKSTLLTEPRVKISYVSLPKPELDITTITDEEINLKIEELAKNLKPIKSRSSEQLIIEFSNDKERQDAEELLSNIHQQLLSDSLTYDDAKKKVEALPKGYIYNAGVVRFQENVDTINSALFSIKNVGEFSVPVVEKNTVHLIRLLSDSDDVQVDKVALREDAKEALILDKKNLANYELLEKFQTLADQNRDNLDLVVEELKAPYVATDWLSLSSRIGELSDNNTFVVINQDSILTTRKNSDAYETDNGEVRIVRVDEYEKKRILTLEEARDDIINLLTQQEAVAKAEQLIKDINQSLQDEKIILSDIPDKYHIDLKEYTSFSLQSIVEKTDNDPIAIESLVESFRLPIQENQQFDTHVIDQSLSGIIVTNIIPGTIEDYTDQELQGFRDVIKANLAQVEQAVFLQGLVKDSKIETFQTSFLSE